MTETEQIIVGLISSAGQSKSLAFEALKKVKTGEYDEARKILEQAKEADLQAHTVQTKLISTAWQRGEGRPRRETGNRVVDGSCAGPLYDFSISKRSN